VQIGEYAYEIVTLSSSLERKPPSQILLQIGDTGAKIRGLPGEGDRQLAVG